MVNIRARGNWPPESSTTSVENFRPTPVSVIIPMMHPAAAQASATGITALAAVTAVSTIRRGVCAEARLKKLTITEAATAQNDDSMIE